MLGYGALFPGSGTLCGVYVDDNFVGGIVPRALGHRAEGEDARLVAAGEKAYDATPGLERAREKEIRFQTNFVCWGTQVR